MDAYERRKNKMYKIIGDASYLHARKKKKIHEFQWEMLWVKFLEVECIARVRNDFSF